MMRRRKPVPPGMKRYIVSAECTISIHTEVFAKSKRAALRIARERGMETIHSSTYEGSADVEWNTSGELDGEPKKLRVEELE